MKGKDKHMTDFQVRPLNQVYTLNFDLQTFNLK